jgi:hypothetical protein
MRRKKWRRRGTRRRKKIFEALGHIHKEPILYFK